MFAHAHARTSRYCATWSNATVYQDVLVSGYLQQQAIMINALQQTVHSNSNGGESGLLFTHKADENAAIASIALTIAVIHALLGL